MPSFRVLKIAVLSSVLILMMRGDFLARLPVQTLTTGKVEGSIQDPIGGLIQGAPVVFETQVGGKKLRRKTKSNRDGFFEISLPTGVYEMSIKYPGFRAFRRRDLLIENGKTKNLNVLLEIDPKKSVNVNAQTRN